MQSHRFTAIVRLLIQVDVREGPKTVAGSDALTISTTKPPHKAEAEALKWRAGQRRASSRKTPNGQAGQGNQVRAEAADPLSGRLALTVAAFSQLSLPALPTLPTLPTTKPPHKAEALK